MSAGGVASGTVVSGIATQWVSGVASGTVRSAGGRQFVYAGGRALGTIENAGADLEVYGGTVNGATVSSGGGLYVSSSGMAIDGTILSGGVGYVFSRGAISGATLSGGFLEIGRGSSAGTSQINFTTGGAGGTLQLDQSVNFHGTRCQFYDGRADWSFVREVKAATTLPVIANGDIETLVISGFGVPGGIDLRDISFASSGFSLGYSGDTTSGILTVTDGTNTATLHLLGQYVAGNFTAQADGNGAP